MARKRSARESSQAQPKIPKASANDSINVVEKQEKQPEVQNTDADKSTGSLAEPEDDREKKLALRQRDKDFVTETEKIKARLLELKKTNPALFRSLFLIGGYLAAFRPDALDSWMSEAKNENERQILKDFWFYTVRFQVWLRPNDKGDGFKKTLACPPYRNKFRARLVNGECQMMEPEPGVEMVYEDLYEDDNLPVPDPAVEKWLQGGRAKLVLLEDQEGQSVLNEIERFAYDPDALTLIVHDSGVMRYLFLLVGEKTTVEDVRAAAKTLTALQRRFYGRSRAGRPTNMPKLAQVLEKLAQKDGKNQREKAADLVPPEEYKTTTADLTKRAAVTLSRTKRTIQPRPTR